MEGFALKTAVFVNTVIQAHTAKPNFNAMILIALTTVHASWNYRLTRPSVAVTSTPWVTVDSREFSARKRLLVTRLVRVSMVVCAKEIRT